MKRKLVKLVEILAYYLGVNALFYWLNRRAKRTLCFHNVLPDGLRIEGEAGAFDEDESHFRFVIREIAKHFQFSTDVLDAATATVTFDDGYLNQYEVAAKVLKEEGNVPAILFVAGDNLDNADPTRCLVTDALTHWVSFSPTVKGDRMRYWREVLRPTYAQDAANRGKAVLAECDAQYSMAQVLKGLSSDYARLRLTGVTTEQVRELRTRGWRVGWHTKSHFPLVQLSASEQRQELTPFELFKGEVMAYPYGCPGSIDEMTAQIAEEVGFPLAMSATTGEPGWKGKFLLPRMYVGGDKYAIHFELSGAKFFLRHRKLLPKVV